MAPTPAQATSSRLPQDGTLAPSTAQFHIGGGTGAIKGVIIVFAILGILAVIAIPVFILKRRSKSPPLPPTQPLAHYREREAKCLPQPYLPHKELDQGSKSGSKEGSLGPVRMSSVRTTDSSQSRPTYGSSSCSSAPLTTFVNASCPLSVNSQSDEQASPSKGYVSTAQLARSSSLSRSRSWSRHELTRESSMSMVDLTRTVSTRTSSRSVSTIRGAPHHPQNNVEIVLPAPLAPQLRDHISAIRGYGHLPERGGLISDQWMVTHLIAAPWCPSADHKLFEGDSSPKRHTYPRLGYQNQPSFDTADQLERSGLHPRPRGRSSSRRTSQPQPSGPGTPTVSPQSADGQIRPLRPTSQDSCDEQGTFMTGSR